MSPILLGLILATSFNLLIFLLAFKLQTDKLTDITYSLTFALLALYFWYTGAGRNEFYKLALMAMPVIWAVRLGTYLLRRVITKGKDHRFDSFRHNFVRFGRFWLLQGVSTWIVSLPAIIGLSASLEEMEVASNSPLMPIGIGIWAVGFIIESIADAQKFNFRMNPANEGKFMAEGLFSIVRFPNYTGEMMCWIGVFLAVIPVLQGMEWASIISPIWISFLLLFLSGIPFLERSNKKRYGHLPEFQTYKKETNKILPFIY